MPCPCNSRSGIAVREGRRKEIDRSLDTLAHVRGLDSAERVKLQQGLRARLDDWRGLLRRGQPIQARQILRKLLVGRLTLTPRVTENGNAYEYAGEATLGRCTRTSNESLPKIATSRWSSTVGSSNDGDDLFNRKWIAECVSGAHLVSTLGSGGGGGQWLSRPPKRSLKPIEPVLGGRARSTADRRIELRTALTSCG